MFCRTQARGGYPAVSFACVFFVSSGERRLRRSSPHILNAHLRGSGPPRRWGKIFECSSDERALAGAEAPSGCCLPGNGTSGTCRKHIL